MNVQGVQKLPFNLQEIFHIQSEEQFLDIALKTFYYQYENCKVYRDYVHLIKRDVIEINSLQDIPFLPISFFKTHQVKSFKSEATLSFQSSGTTGQNRSIHHIYDPSLYQLSFIKGFENFYGHINDFIIIGLLPSYMENDQSSLIYMVDHLIELSGDLDSGFFLNDYERLLNIVAKRKGEKKILVFGVSYALLDLAEKFEADLSDCFVMETGGMKGRREELTKTELHSILRNGLNIENVHSEYGMTEMLSQAYSKGGGTFLSPAWMKVLLRKPTDPFDLTANGSGGINVIDLANIYSCSFIETEDLGRKNSNGFEVLGRLDNSDLRGCNLLIQ